MADDEGRRALESEAGGLLVVARKHRIDLGPLGCEIGLGASEVDPGGRKRRIDLGLGRAPGTDQLTLRALRRTPESAENFPQDVLEVQAFLADDPYVRAGLFQRVEIRPWNWSLGAPDARP